MMDLSRSLGQQSREVKGLFVFFVLSLMIGVSIGLIYVASTTSLTPDNTAEHYRGSQTNDDFDIPEKYAKTLSGMLLTTHTHVISFSIIFFLLGILFSMTSMIQGPWKMVLLIEPFASFLLTFLSIWGLRYVSTYFSMTTIFFGILTYVSFYLISSIILYELLIYKK